MNFHLLRLFAAVALHRSFSRAAEALHVSQPAVSKGVRVLESQLGEALFERGTIGLRLTQAGEILARHASAVFLAERRAEEELAALQGLERGLLRVGASTTIGTYLLPPILGAFHRAYPAIELRFTSANTHTIAELLMNWDLDIALVEGPVEEFDLEIRPWRDDELVLIAAPNHRLAQIPVPVAPELLNQELVLIREVGSGTREVVLSALAARGLRPAETLDVSSTEAIKQLVMAGVGVAIVSSASIPDQVVLDRLRFIPMRDFVIKRPLTRLGVPRRAPMPAATRLDRLLDRYREFEHVLDHPVAWSRMEPPDEPPSFEI